MIRTDFTLSTPMVIGIIGTLLAISLTTSYYWGKTNGISEMKEAAIVAEQQWNKKIASVREDYEASIETIKDEYTRNVTSLQKQISTLEKNPKTITKYITKEENFQLPYGFMAWHDKAIRGESLAESILLDKKCEYTLTDLGLVVAKNYTACNECMEKLTALQKIVREFQKKQWEMKK